MLRYVIFKIFIMKTHEMKVVTNNRRSIQTRMGLIIPLMITMLILSTGIALAHCDTMDGPLIGDAKKSISENNVNYALKWVSAAHEKEIKETFELMMKVRLLSPEAKELSEKYFFETLVRIHRTGEGVPYTGIKPAGSPIDEKVRAADKSIEVGNLSPLEGMISKEDWAELSKRFDQVMHLKNYNVDQVEDGREYIEAYVRFFKFAEGEEEGHSAGHSLEGHEGH